jgi:uncharacterized BrkB/YihY/UPF0761 family membrane protein
MSCRFPGVNFRRRVIAPLTAFLAAVFVLALAPMAMAADGVGLAGRVNDKYITFFCFGIIAFFAILVTVLSLIYDRMEAKKEQRRSDLDRFNS